MARIYVIIVSHNTSTMASELVRSLAAQTEAGTEISTIVIDNLSKGPDVDTLERELDGLERVTLIKNDANIGFGAAVNQAVRTITTDDPHDLVWILNPDVTLDTRSPDLLEAALARDEFDIVSPAILTGDRHQRTVWYAGGSVDLSRIRVTHWMDGAPEVNLPTAPYRTDFITGAAPMMRLGTWHSLGGFRPGYFLYWEDVLLSSSAARMGYRLGVVPAARIWHMAGAASAKQGGLSPVFFYWATRNRFLYALDVGLGARVALSPAAWTETARYILRAPTQSRSRFRCLLAAVRGTVAGYLVLRQPRPARPSRLSIYAQIRSAHYERELADPDHVILYFREHPDLDPTLSRTDIRQTRPLRAVVAVLTSDPGFVEVPEPLWLRWLPVTLAITLAARLRSVVTRRRVTVTSYALQNASTSQLLLGVPTPARASARYLLRWVLRLQGAMMDRVVFGTPGAQCSYDRVAGGHWAVRERQQMDALPAPCSCGPRQPTRYSVLFASGLEERKGVRQLLAAWPGVTSGIPDAVLRMAGEGPLEEFVRERAREDGSIVFLGALNRDELHAEFRRAETVVLFSQPQGRWREQIGLPLLEALAHGARALTSDQSGLASWLESAGYPVVPHNAEPEVLAKQLVEVMLAEEDLNPPLPTADGRVRADQWLHRMGSPRDDPSQAIQPR